LYSKGFLEKKTANKKKISLEHVERLTYYVGSIPHIGNNRRATTFALQTLLQNSAGQSQSE